MTVERTLVLVKPDGVRRGLIGTVIHEIEVLGLDIQELAIVKATREQVLMHYRDDKEWLLNAGNRALDVLRSANLDPLGVIGEDDPLKIGETIRERLVDYLCSGPLVVIIATGVDAVGQVRTAIGASKPATDSSIRARFGTDDVISSFRERRALENVVHSSATADEAELEAAIWVH